MKGNIVLWECIICGNEWKGKSPRVRKSAPLCSGCGSRTVRVKDWLIDKEKWKKARLQAFKRAKWQCEACGKDLNLSAPAHHLDYEDYYNSDDLVCLCPHCHYLIHGDSSFYIGIVLRYVGLLAIAAAIYMRWWIVPRSQLQTILILILMTVIVAIVGIGFIFLSQRLTKETRMVRGKIKKAVRNRNKLEKSISGGDKINDLEERETYCCEGCGRELPETEYWQSGGLCDRCRGMPLQQGFPAPPGFPKF